MWSESICDEQRGARTAGRRVRQGCDVLQQSGCARPACRHRSADECVGALSPYSIQRTVAVSGRQHPDVEDGPLLPGSLRPGSTRRAQASAGASSSACLAVDEFAAAVAGIDGSPAAVRGGASRVPVADFGCRIPTTARGDFQQSTGARSRRGDDRRPAPTNRARTADRPTSRRNVRNCRRVEATGKASRDGTTARAPCMPATHGSAAHPDSRLVRLRSGARESQEPQLGEASCAQARCSSSAWPGIHVRAKLRRFHRPGSDGCHSTADSDSSWTASHAASLCAAAYCRRDEQSAHGAFVVGSPSSRSATQSFVNGFADPFPSSAKATAQDACLRSREDRCIRRRRRHRRGRCARGPVRGFRRRTGSAMSGPGIGSARVGAEARRPPPHRRFLRAPRVTVERTFDLAWKVSAHCEPSCCAHVARRQRLRRTTTRLCPVCHRGRVVARHVTLRPDLLARQHCSGYWSPHCANSA
jgi:hypothetical protein